MTIRIPISTLQNKWSDAQRVDKDDLDTEQGHKNQIDSAIVQNHFGSGVLLETPEQKVLFDTTNLTVTQAAILAAGNFDGIGLEFHDQPSDINLGNQLEVELLNSDVFGRLSVKVLIIGLSFDNQLIMDKLTFHKNEKQVTAKHYKRLLSVLFNDFKGNNNCSRNNGGEVTIKEAAPFELSRDPIMVSQDVMPDLFFRDFKTSGTVTSTLPGISDLYATLQDAIGSEYTVDALDINITHKQIRTIPPDDVVLRFGQKFLATTNNIQKVTLLLGAARDDSAAIANRFDWSGDLIVSVHALQTSVNCPTDIIPDLAIDFDPDPVPLVEVSFSQAELYDLGYVLTDTPQPVDFVFSSSKLSLPGGIEVGKYYVVTFRRSGGTSVGSIFAETGTDKTDNSRLTIFTGIWTDVPEEDMWFQIWTDAAKVADGQGYDIGNGIYYPKTKIDVLTGATVDNQEKYFSFANTGERTRNVGILQAINKESLETQDERTGNNVFSRKQFVPSFSFVTDSGLVDLLEITEPLVIGSVADTNPKNNNLLVKSQDYPGLAKGSTFIVINPDPDLLSLNLIGSKLVPNDASSMEYRIFSVILCTDGYGDVNGDGQIDEEDVTRASQLIGESLSLNTTQQKIVDGEISTLELLRADVDGDGIVTANDVDLIQDFIDRSINSFPVGYSFTHLSIQVQSSVGRYDGYFDCDGYVRLDGYSGLQIVDPTLLDPFDLVYYGQILPPNINGSDPAFNAVPFVPVDFEVVPQPFWKDYQLNLSSGARKLPQTFSYPSKVSEEECSQPLTFSCEDRGDIKPEHDPGRNDFYAPDNLIIGTGQILRPDGSFYKTDVEVHTIILQLPQVPLEESVIDVFHKLVADRGDGFTAAGYPAARYADCTTVKLNDLALNKLRFSVSLQSFVPSLDGYTELDGYGIIIDDIIGVHMDQVNGILSLTIKDLVVDPVYLTLVTKIQILVYLKRAGWNNNVLVIEPGAIEGLVAV